MFIKIIIFSLTLILAVAIILCFGYFLALTSAPISSGISGVGNGVGIVVLLYCLPIAAILESALLAVLTYQGWVPLHLGIGAICVFCLIALIVLCSPLFKRIFS